MCYKWLVLLTLRAPLRAWKERQFPIYAEMTLAQGAKAFHIDGKSEASKRPFLQPCSRKNTKDPIERRSLLNAFGAFGKYHGSSLQENKTIKEESLETARRKKWSHWCNHTLTLTDTNDPLLMTDELIRHWRAIECSLEKYSRCIKGSFSYV